MVNVHPEYGELSAPDGPEDADCLACHELANDMFDPAVHVGHGDWDALYRELLTECTHNATPALSCTPSKGDKRGKYCGRYGGRVYPLDDRERHDLRERAVSHAAYMHSDTNMTFEREDAVKEMLKTAGEIYDWILGE